MKYLKFVMILILLIVISILGFVSINKHNLQNELKSKTDITSTNGIQTLEELDINGDKQWISIRGQDKSNPVILMVHGGPGSPDLSMARYHDFITEKYFVVVRWDQRNAGKSFHFLSSSGTLEIDTFIKDIHDLTQYLKKSLNKEKIFLAGHSWGSIISLLAVNRYPQDYIAYIGIGQFVNARENESVSYRFTLQEAQKDKNDIAINELTQIGEPPYNSLQDLGKEREWLGYYGGGMYHGELKNDMYQHLGKMMFSSPEYSLLDNLRFFAGMATSLIKVWPHVDGIDLPNQAKTFKIPVYFLIGRYDYNTPWELSERYFNLLSAPKKKYVWFENSAHAPNYEEPEAFGNELKKIRDDN